MGPNGNFLPCQNEKIPQFPRSTPLSTLPVRSLDKRWGLSIGFLNTIPSALQGAVFFGPRQKPEFLVPQAGAGMTRLLSFLAAAHKFATNVYLPSAEEGVSIFVRPAALECWAKKSGSTAPAGRSLVSGFGSGVVW